MAPEVLNCPLKDHPDENKEVTRLHYTSSVDTWAVGCLAFELVGGGLGWVGCLPSYRRRH
jgi:aurora kinase